MADTKKYFFVGLLCLFFFQMLSGQRMLDRINLLDAEIGLSQSTNEFIYNDSKGYIWISSTDGLNRFDGASVTVFKPDKEVENSLKDANIQSPFFEDDRGNIWFATVNSINCFRRQHSDFRQYYLNERVKRPGTSTHYAFHLEQGRYLWASVYDSLYRLDIKNPTDVKYVHPLAASRCAVQVSPDGVVIRLFACFWVVHHGFEVIDYGEDGAVTKRDTFFMGDDHSIAQALTVRKAIPENDSLVWFATDQGLLAFNPLNPKQYQMFKPNGEVPGLRDIYRQKDGQLWVITESGTIISFNSKLGFGSILTDDRGQIIEDARVLHIDNENNLWYSVFGTGVFFSRFATKQFIHPLNQKKDHQVEINALFEHKNGSFLCVGKLGNSFIVEPNLMVSNKVDMPSRSRFIQDSEGAIWNISTDGLGRWDDKLGKVVNVVPIKGLRLTDIVELKNQDFVIGTTQKALKISRKDLSIEIIPNLPEGILDLHLDKKNRLWVGGIKGDLSLWEMYQNAKPVRISEIPNSALVHHLFEDDIHQCIWAATANGLIKVNFNTLESTLITEKDGLPNQYIYAVISDKSGNIWLSTNQGITKYMPDKPISQRFKQYTTLNGLLANEYRMGSALLSSTGHIWFGSTKGVEVFHPDSIRDIGNAPQLAIVGLKIHDHEWRDSSTCIEMANRIELAYNENTLRLELAAMEYTFPEMNKFRVRLLKNGNDTSWVDLGTQNFITYANLRPGNYKFEFTACNSEGIWQETPRQLEIIIHPHFTQTWWFPWLVGALSLIVIGFGTAFYYRYQLRLQQLALEKQQREAERKQLLLENELALQEERNRIADEMHDELGGGLSTIRLASQRAQKVQSPDELQGILKRVSQISIGLVNNMRGIIWAMDSQNDSLRSLLAYIRQYAGTFLDDNGIAATLSLPSDFPDHSLSSQYRHNVMLTVKECLNNILKHAEATAVELSVDLDNQLHIHIRDNGKGFEPMEHAGMGKGLRTTVKRMESVGGSIEWRRNPEGGMTVTLLAPLP